MPRSLLARKPVATIAFSMSGANITTAAYTQLIAAMAAPASAVEVFSPSGSSIKLAVGGAGAEVDIPYTIPPGGSAVFLPLEIKAGVRLSAKALDANATTGLLILNFFG